MRRCNPGIDTEQTVVSCLELSVALEGTQSGGEGSCASYGGAALVADGIQHSLPRYSVSALILVGLSHTFLGLKQGAGGRDFQESAAPCRRDTPAAAACS